MYTFGCNDEGALGRQGEECTPGVVKLPGSVVQVSAGDSHTGLLMADGSVYACGTFRVSTLFSHHPPCFVLPAAVASLSQLCIWAGVELSFTICVSLYPRTAMVLSA